MAERTMLVDATQPEETRVAIVSEDGLLQDFDFESKVIQQIKSNIYLAKVTRVEPSLQAAFLEYGGNRQGFLPFTEIHPDYFRIPVADRQKLMEQEQTHTDDEGDEDDDDLITQAAAALAAEDAQKASMDDDEDSDDENDDDHDHDDSDDHDHDEHDESDDEAHEGAADDSDVSVAAIKAAKHHHGDAVDQEIEDAKPRFRISHRHYKIQEVIKPRQIMLVQVTKEERGNKGAAVSTFISLPGRYCVLMPNSTNGGGVSRKINNSTDRKKMKQLLTDLEVPSGMSVILRTAGIGRNKTEIKRDLDYLLRLWNKIRELTLKSTAPACVYEEGDLIQRSIRDLYGKEIDNIVVCGKDGYRQAKDFMKMLMPSHAKKIQEYKDEKVPLFQKYGVEKQIADIFSPTAYMRSGGYIVINPTEALVSIDVNSGRSTKERHIEETALQTNLEAAEEVARQLRLRDLGGLVVVDFIDMEAYRNNRLVEKRLRECLGRDRARVQVGRISNFGLLELSRQRLRPSLFETNYQECPHCKGIGRVRTVESASLMVLRIVEREAIAGGAGDVFVKVHSDVALYILNQKRSIVNEMETNHGVRIFINAASGYSAGQYEVSRLKGVVHSSEALEEERAAEAHRHAKNHRHDNRNDRRHGKHDGKHEGRGQDRHQNRNEKRHDHHDRDRQDDHDGDSENRHNHQNRQNRHHEGAETGEEGENNRRRRRRGRRGGRRRNRDQRDENRNDNRNENQNSVKSDGSQDVRTQDAPRENKAPVDAVTEASAPADTTSKSGTSKGRRPKNANKPEKTKSAAQDTKETVSPDSAVVKSIPIKNSNDNKGDEVKAPAPASASAVDAPQKKTGPKKKGWWQKLKE